jgi:hypothetical protein
MSIFNKKNDVKNHLSPRFRTKTYLAAPLSRPDADSRSLAEPDAIGTSRSPFAMDYSVEHTTAGASSTPVANPADTTDSRKPDAPKSARA